jgi:hypothetical protein
MLSIKHSKSSFNIENYSIVEQKNQINIKKVKKVLNYMNVWCIIKSWIGNKYYLREKLK